MTQDQSTSSEEKTTGPQYRTEEFTVTGDAVVSKIKELIQEGNIRRITLKNEEGKTLIEIPLIVGAAAAILLPVWAAVGAIAALAANLTVVIERVDKEPPAQP